jgi:pilus assembly protein Flp/PilA
MTGRFARVAIAFLKKEDGPTSVEYAVVLALIIAVVISVSNIGNSTNSTYANPVLQKATGPGSSGS